MKMFARCLFYLTLISVVVIEICGETRVAIAHLLSENVTGTIEFTETDEGIHITGTIAGLPEGLYGFHVHELGDTKDCNAAGGHFNPDNTTHGGPQHEERHVGDLGNVHFVGNKPTIAKVDLVDNQISLRGRNNVLGRSVVLHAQKDDLGLGNHAMSPITGNAGPRVACGVIGIKSPSAPWNSAMPVTPHFKLLVVILLLIFTMYYKY